MFFFKIGLKKTPDSQPHVVFTRRRLPVSPVSGRRSTHEYNYTTVLFYIRRLGFPVSDHEGL